MAGSVGIVAVQDVVETSKLLAGLFNWKSAHGGPEFDILVNGKNIPTLLLHDFDEHEHARFKGIKSKSKGIGQSLYVFVTNIDEVYEKVK